MLKNWSFMKKLFPVIAICMLLFFAMTCIALANQEMVSPAAADPGTDSPAGDSMSGRILDMIHTVYPLCEKDPGEYAHMQVNGVDFTLSVFEAEGLGNVSVMSGALPSVMRMDTIIVNPFERDMPLLSYDRIYSGDTDVLLLELYDTQLEYVPDTAVLAKIKETVSDLPDYPRATAWYDAILYPENIAKTVSAESGIRLDEITERYVDEFLRLAAGAPVCDREAKRKAATYYTESLLSNGGMSTNGFKTAKGDQFTRDLFRSALFGTGEPE